MESRSLSKDYEELSQERKDLQDKGLLPEWYTTGGYQLLKKKYLSEGETPYDRYRSVAKTAAQYTTDPETWEEKFFNVMWRGWLSPATPVLSNMGTNKGCSVSCSGTYVGDNIYSFYEKLKENALLSKHGFGTSAYLGDIRPRGEKFGVDGKASGVLPVLKDFITMAQKVSQGSSRRGSVGLYLDVAHKDFYEVADHLFHYPEDNNIGWIFKREDYDNLNKGDEETLKRYQRIMKIRSVLGRGYLMKDWTAQEQRPQMYKDLELDVKASNLCSEIMLHSSEDLTYTCVLSSMNVRYWDEWKDTDAVFVATVFLDCVAEHFIKQGENIQGLERAVEFTKKGRALGLGVLGYHTYLQENMIPFEGFQTMMLNNTIFKHIHDQSLEASQWMSKEFGEPEWCKGYGVRNTHRCVRADTRILTKEGSLPIVDTVGKEVEIWNGYEWSKVTPYKTGNNERLFRVYTSDGRFLDCTEDHMWMVASPERSTYGGNKTLKVETSKLRVGDCLVKKLGAVTEGYLGKLHHAYTNGFFSGDGSINCSKKGKYPRNELRLYDDKVLVKDRISWKSKETWDATINGKVRGIRGYITDELLPKYEVPINYDLRSRLDWLAGIIDSDGSSNSKGISITTSKEDFADGIMELLTTLGCHGNKTKIERKEQYGGGYYFSINITMMECNTLIDLGLVLSRVKYKRSKENTLQKLSSKHFVKVVGIVDLGIKEDTYCLTDPKNGSCVFNGILTAQCAVAPTMSTSLLVGGISQGIEPIAMNVFSQVTAAGTVRRINPTLLRLMESRGVYKEETLDDIEENAGSVQHVNWLSDSEKEVFKTAFEINQKSILQAASQRQKWICQSQSLNLFFGSDESEEWISEVIQEFFNDPYLITLYYQRSQAGVKASKGDCVACEA